MIRLAKPKDRIEIIERIRAYLMEQEIAGSPVLCTPKTVEAYRKLIFAYLSGSMAGTVVVAEEEGKIVGFAMAGETGAEPSFDSRIGRKAEVHIAWVHPSFRKTGLGLSMLSFGRPFLLEQGFETAVMCVREGNPEGQALTAAYGAVPIERFYMIPLSEEPNHGKRSQSVEQLEELSGDALSGDGDPPLPLR